MNKLLGVRADFLDADASVRLEECALACGFDITHIGKKPDAFQMQNCAVLFGSIPPSWLKDFSALRWLQCQSAGVDSYLSPDIYPNPDVILTNSSGAYGVTIAEHILTVLLMLLRRMPEYNAITTERGWKNIGNIRSIFGSTLAIIGTGDIGSQFAKRARALGAAKIIGVRRTQCQKPDWADEIYQMSDISLAVSDADAVIFALPSTPLTQNVLNRELISHMRTDAFVINVGRGNAVDQDALTCALNSGRLAGAALDVTVPEPLPPTSPLWSAKNILITPHVAGNMTLGLTAQRALDIFLNNLRLFSASKPMTNVIDRTIGY